MKRVLFGAGFLVALGAAGTPWVQGCYGTEADVQALRAADRLDQPPTTPSVATVPVNGAPLPAADLGGYRGPAVHPMGGTDEPTVILPHPAPDAGYAMPVQPEEPRIMEPDKADAGLAATQPVLAPQPLACPPYCPPNVGAGQTVR